MDKRQKVHHKEISFNGICRNIENHDVVKLCKKTSTKGFGCKITLDFNNFVQSGKN